MSDASIRHRDLRQMLATRRRDMQETVQNRLREGRAQRACEVADALECSDASIHTDIDLACLQIRAETLIRIDEALARLEAGDYGMCSACGGEIAERRLHALPFSVRCRTCEDRRERETRHRGRAAYGARGGPLFADSTE